MAKATLPTNYKDDILNSSMNGKRRYQEIPNSDGTISLEDKTTYDQTGTNFGASQVNEMNRNINESADAGRIIDSLSSVMTNTQQKYIAGALALKEVNNSLSKVKTYVGSDGKLHFVDASGADAVLNFSGNVKFNTYRVTTTSTSGSAPSVKVVLTDYTGAVTEKTATLTASYSDRYFSLQWYQSTLVWVMGGKMPHYDNTTQSMGNFEGAVAATGQITTWSYTKTVDYTVKIPVIYE